MRARASMGSPRAVPVPWASTASTWPGGRRAAVRAAVMTRCWAGPLGAVSWLLAPSWLTAEPVMRARTGWPAARASDRRSSRRRPAPSGQATLAGELDEDAGGGHHGDAAGQGQGALAAAEGLGGEVDGDEGGGAGGVDGDGGALEAEGVGQAAGGDAGGVARQQVALEALGRLL